MAISVIGVNHRTAPVEVRERVSLPGDLGLQLLEAIRAERVFDEAMVLDTCNRTEVYFVAAHAEDPLDHLLAHIAALKGASPPADTSVFYRHDGSAAVAHLFSVAASLDSQIVGEDEILGQVKKAYRLALQARTARFLLGRLLHRAFRVGKRVRTETELGRGASSVAQAAGELARQIFSTLANRKVLLVGAGENAELAARTLIRGGCGGLIVANRTPARARQLAEELLRPPRQADALGDPACLAESEGEDAGCPALREIAPECSLYGKGSPGEARAFDTRAIELAEIPAVIGEVDLVICSTGAPDFVLRCEPLTGGLARRDRPLLIIDIAVPRDVEPRLGELPDVFLYNIDHLDRLVAENIDRRRREIPRAEAIVEWETRQFARWLDSLQVAPTIKLLQRRFDLLRVEQIKRYGKNFGPAGGEQLEKFAGGLLGKVLHSPMAFLRELSADGSSTDGLVAVDLVRRIFDLDSLEPEE